MKVPLCKLADIPAAGTIPIKFFDRDVLVYHSGGEPRAVFDACVHLGGPLERRGDNFVCPWHGAHYDCASGLRLSGPAGTHERLLILPTIVENETLSYVYGQ